MKICVKCKTEYPDDMTFCSYCGTPLQTKAQDFVCQACGKVIHADNLRFCPYCGQRFDSSGATKSNIHVDIRPAINKPLSTTNSDNNASYNSEKSSEGSFLKNALTVVGVFILISLARACGNVLSR